MQQALKLSAVAYCRQVHGRRILVPRKAGLAGRGDGLVTVDGGMGLMGFAADCPLILAADPVSGAVGLAHASWRGTVMRIAAELVSQLVSDYRADPADLVACICPSAGPCCYEIGPDVLQLAAAGLGPAGPAVHRETRRPRSTSTSGPPTSTSWSRPDWSDHNVYTAGLCTVCRNDLFPSHRAEGEQAGRFVAVIAQP